MLTSDGTINRNRESQESLVSQASPLQEFVNFFMPKTMFFKIG